jgi:hypothetical protein
MGSVANGGRESDLNAGPALSGETLVHPADQWFDAPP